MNKKRNINNLLKISIAIMVYIPCKHLAGMSSNPPMYTCAWVHVMLFKKVIKNGGEGEIK